MANVARKNALVIGAGRYDGIGDAICRNLASNGINVIFSTCIDYDSKFIKSTNYQQLVDDCLYYGIICDWVSCDFRNNYDIHKVFDFAEKTFGNTVDILIYCSCYYSNDVLENITQKEIDDNFSINAKAPFLLCQEYYKRFCGNFGRIILLSSTQALEPLTQSVSYGVTKSIVPGIVYTLFPILGKKNITINAINSGPTMVGYVGETDAIPIEKLPFKRIGKTEDVTNLVEFLVSSKGEWITGQVINSEGGLVRNSL